MHISKIQLTNIKCFEEFTLNLETDGKPVLWTMIVGDNAVGKSCLLESIAMGLCDEASAAALMKELPGGLIRKGTPVARGNKISGSICINFKKPQGKLDGYTIKTEIKKEPPDAPAKLKQTLDPKEAFPWQDVFICGYGPQRASDADRSYDEYDPLAAVYTLFNYESTLQNPELVLRRQPKRRRDQFKKRLLKVLMLDEKKYKVVLTETGMDIKGAWGNLPLWSLSDGYKSTTFWLLDFLAWQIYFRTKNSKTANGRKAFSGVLLIDELEQHLHPKWQRYIVQILRDQFPKVQFITTTHSPLVTLGVSEISNAKIVMLKRKDQKITYDEMDPEEIKAMRADQVLISDVFDLPIARSAQTGDKILRFRELYLKDYLTQEEKKQFNRLKAELIREAPSVFENEENRKILQETKRARERLDNSEGNNVHDKD